MTNLYRILKLKRKATPEEIEKAYRKAALEHHPDRGGDRDKFEVARLAYEVLIDPKRRAEYDATGNYATSTIDTSERPIIDTLGQWIAVCLRALVDHGGSPKVNDLVKIIRDNIKTKIGELKTCQMKAKTYQESLIESQSRFELEGDGENVMANIVRAHIKLIDQEIAALKSQEELQQKVLSFIARYRYRFDKQLAARIATAGWVTSNTSATGTW